MSNGRKKVRYKVSTYGCIFCPFNHTLQSFFLFYLSFNTCTNVHLSASLLARRDFASVMKFRPPDPRDFAGNLTLYCVIPRSLKRSDKCK